MPRSISPFLDDTPAAVTALSIPRHEDPLPWPVGRLAMVRERSESVSCQDGAARVLLRCWCMWPAGREKRAGPDCGVVPTTFPCSYFVPWMLEGRQVEGCVAGRQPARVAVSTTSVVGRRGGFMEDGQGVCAGCGSATERLLAAEKGIAWIACVKSRALRDQPQMEGIVLRLRRRRRLPLHPSCS